jgi:diguanylate cyclase (GGDEF)-like protein
MAAMADDGADSNAKLEQVLAACIARGRRTGRGVALAVIRLIELRDLAERFGRPLGRELGRQFLERLRKAMRGCDRVVQSGPDEFAVLLLNLEGPVSLGALVERVIRSATGLYRVDRLRLDLTASAGVSCYPRDANTPKELLFHARVALNRSNALARPRYQIFSPLLMEQEQQRLAIVAQVREAIENDRLVLHYQPQYDLLTRRIVGAEALLRFADTTGQLVLPVRFIDIVAQTYLIVPVGNWVIRQACRQFRRWREAGHPVARIAVNVSPRQLMDVHLVSVINAALAENGLDGEDLEVEIKERHILDNLPQVREQIDALGTLGLRVAVDDFGTDPRFLVYLARLPLHKLKIDRWIVREQAASERARRAVAAMVATANELGLDVIAEGVDRPALEPYLTRLGCQLGQGFEFSPPLSAEGFGQLLTAS